MANKLINEMDLPKWMANIFSARNLTTAKDALSLTEFELMELLDVGFSEVTSAVAHISAIASPPYQTAWSLMEQRRRNEDLAGHLPTILKGLDEALCGGIPFGVLTEVVGPAGIGKTQFCLKLSLLASLPTNYGGLDGRVVYIDVESKFSSRRMIEIGAESFPEIFHLKGMAQAMAGRILVLQPSSLSEFTESLQQIKVLLLQHQVKLLVIDSMAALVSGECEQGAPEKKSLGWHISFIKSLAEFSRIPIMVTNQVRSQSLNGACQYSFQENNRGETAEDPARYDSHLVAALGIQWAHAVTIRLVLEAKSGKRFMKVAKSPISPPLEFPFIINSSGILLLNDDGTELIGPEINAIHCQGTPLRLLKSYKNVLVESQYSISDLLLKVEFMQEATATSLMLMVISKVMQAAWVNFQGCYENYYRTQERELLNYNNEHKELRIMLLVSKPSGIAY